LDKARKQSLPPLFLIFIKVDPELTFCKAAAGGSRGALRRRIGALAMRHCRPVGVVRFQNMQKWRGRQPGPWENCRDARRAGGRALCKVAQRLGLQRRLFNEIILLFAKQLPPTAGPGMRK